MISIKNTNRFKKGKSKSKQRYKNKTMKKNYLDNNELYIKNAYDSSIFEQIKQICNTIKNENMILDHKASGRTMYTFPLDSLIYSLIYNEEFVKKMRIITNNPKLAPCVKIPIEYRKYGAGSYMRWHKDVKLFETQNQYECVLTITNTSNSKTLVNKHTYIKRIHSIPNSLIVVKANGVEHKVTTTTSGERTIIKFIFCEMD